MSIIKTRKISYIARERCSIEKELIKNGVSHEIRQDLRKKMGLVTVIENGAEKPCRIVDEVLKGQDFCITLEDEITRDIPPYEFPIEIVYEDEDVAVLNKPSGIATISTKAHFGRSLENALANRWGSFIYRPVNRLDRDTSGLMLVAKNKLSHSILNLSHIEREYTALCEGEFFGSGEIEAPIKKSQTMMRVIDESGQYAKTAYEVLKTVDGMTLVRLKLFTGRTHQIRVHMKSIGHPLVCDKLYGSGGKVTLKNGEVLERQALHSSFLCFTHPVSKEKMSFRSMASFEEALK